MYKMERDIDQLRQQFSDLHKRYVSTDGKIDKILDLLEGDKFANGMIEAVKDHEVRIKKLEDLKSKATWTVLGMSVPSGYGLMEILKKIWPPLIILILFTGCITQQKKEDLFHQYARENRHEVLVYCPEPTVQVVQGSTVEIPGETRWLEPDSIPCPDGSFVTHEPIPCDCPPSTHRVDTVTIIDNAKLEAQEIISQRLANQLASQQGANEQLNKQAKSQRVWIIVLSLCLAVLVAMWLVKLFK